MYVRSQVCPPLADDYKKWFHVRVCKYYPVFFSFFTYIADRFQFLSVITHYYYYYYYYYSCPPTMFCFAYSRGNGCTNRTQTNCWSLLCVYGSAQKWRPRRRLHYGKVREKQYDYALYLYTLVLCTYQRYTERKMRLVFLFRKLRTTGDPFIYRASLLLFLPLLWCWTVDHCRRIGLFDRRRNTINTRRLGVSRSVFKK